MISETGAAFVGGVAHIWIVPVHNGAGLPLRLAIHVTVHRFLLSPGLCPSALRWTLPILTPRLKVSIPYLEPNLSPTKWGATAAHPGVRRLLYQEKLRERRRDEASLQRLTITPAHPKAGSAFEQHSILAVFIEP